MLRLKKKQLIHQLVLSTVPPSPILQRFRPRCKKRKKEKKKEDEEFDEKKSSRSICSFFFFASTSPAAMLSFLFIFSVSNKCDTCCRESHCIR